MLFQIALPMAKTKIIINKSHYNFISGNKVFGNYSETKILYRQRPATRVLKPIGSYSASLLKTNETGNEVNNCLLGE